MSIGIMDSCCATSLLAGRVLLSLAIFVPLELLLLLINDNSLLEAV